MDKDIIVSIIYNISLLLALGTVYTILPLKIIKYRENVGKILVGITLGLIGIGIMFAPFEIEPGIVLDSRIVLVGLTGLVMGPLPTVITVLLTGAFRVIQGGAGVVAGLFEISVAAVVGLIFRYFRIREMIESRRKRYFELLMLGIILSVCALVSRLFLPEENVFSVLNVITAPILILFPFGTFIMGAIMFNEVDNINLYTKLRESQERLRITLMSVGDGVLATDSMGKITLLNSVAEEIIGWTYDDAKGKPSKEVFRLINEYTLKKSEDPVQRVLSSGEIISLSNHTEVIRKDGTRRPIADSAAPIRDEEGNIIGTVVVFRDVTQEREREKEISRLAFHDSLTGLYNRSYFENELTRLDVKRKLPLSIIIADVNGLKLTNDAFGHHMGDELLKKMADAIKSACRQEDIVTRWGGDEFIVLLPNTNEKTANIVRSRIAQKCGDVQIPYVNCSISLGNDTKTSMKQDMKQVIKNAEDSMYRMKSSESSSIRGVTINTILRTFLEKNPREQLHSNRVSDLCKQIGRAMELPEKEIYELGAIGLMHDIGKIAIPESILNKNGRLDDSDWEEMKRHPEIGFRILSSSNNTSFMADHVLNHHERIDGKGYPNGIKGDEISEKTRILSIADAYDAMTSDRPYKERLNKEQAISHLKALSGTYYDKDIVDVFINKVLENKKGE